MKFNEQLPFRTDDAVLAFALYMAGVPEWRPPMNVYDAEMLKRRGYVGVELEQAAMSEFSKGNRGHVTYWFEATPYLKKLLPCYADQQKEFNEDTPARDIGVVVREIMAKAAGRDPVTSEACEPMDEYEALIRIACVALKGRIAYVNRWQERDGAYVRVREAGDVKLEKVERRKDGKVKSVTVTEPGFKLVPLFASDELKEEMRLK